MQVYVLTIHELNTHLGHHVNRVEGVFENLEKAQDAMEKLIKRAIKDFDYGYDAETYERGDMCWSIWEEGWGLSNFCDIKITKARTRK